MCLVFGIATLFAIFAPTCLISQLGGRVGVAQQTPKCIDGAEYAVGRWKYKLAFRCIEVMRRASINGLVCVDEHVCVCWDVAPA